MARAYPFLDIAVLDDVRERFAAGDALAILSVDLARILWANGAGAELLGYSGVEDAIEREPHLSPVARRQLTALSGFPDIGKNRPVAVRIGVGLIVFHASAITLPGGENAILLATSVTDELPETTRASRVISGIDGPGQFAALIDAQGNVAAATRDFSSLKLDSSILHGLLEDVRAGELRLVKRHISAARNLPAGIARLTDETPLHLLLIVDDEPFEESSPSPTPQLSTEATGEPAQEPAKDNPVHAEPTPLAGSEASEAQTVRFAWRTDAEGRFVSISKEFCEAVGEPAADVIGRTFRDVSNTFGLDLDGAIHRLMERRDTWSGRTVMWPIAGTRLKVPVDLAGLPVYGRGKVFEGFRGFGIARMSETADDPEGIGTVLLAASPHEAQASIDPQPDEDIEPVSSLADNADDTSDPFVGERPAIQISKEHTRRASDKGMNPTEEKSSGLSPAERLAFREIGERLRRANEAIAARNKENPVADQDTAEAQPSPSPAIWNSDPQLDQPPSSDAAQTSWKPLDEEPEPLTSIEDTAPEPEDVATIPADEPIAELAPLETSRQRFREVRSLLSLVPTAKHAAVTAPVSAPAQIEPEQALPPSAPAPSNDVEHLIAHLPLPVLIHSGDELHFANKEFLLLTGYEDLPSLAEAGGIGALFDDPPNRQTPDDTTLHLRTAGGHTVPVQTRLQSIRWEGRKTLMLGLRPVARPVAREPFESTPSGLGLREMQAIVDTAADGVIIITNEGDISSLNAPAEALFGFNSEHVVGKPFSALFAIESKRTVQDYVAAMGERSVNSVLNDGRHVIGREAQGRFIPLFITLARLPDDKGYCAVLRDISHWKRVEDELTQARSQAERASSHKSEFLARVSHEIRTPLNAIIGFSELMIDEKFGPIGNDRYRDYLRDINRSGNHVLDLVNDLLDISKIEAGEQEMHFEAVSLNEALEQAVSMMQPQANGERVIIRSSLATRIPNIVADLRSVRQIALNLLSNAVRYTPAGGQIIVSTAYQPDGSVVLRVRDTGIGMSPTEVEEALKPFRQINALRRKRGDGTGLGLPLTRAMVEANRAFFSINSTPGEGTLVEITFPATRVLAD